MHGILSIDIGYKNLGYTLMTFTENPVSFDKFKIRFDIFNISEQKTGCDTVVAARCFALQNFFCDIADECILDYILIEKQVPTNTKAMELMYSIYSFALQYCPPKRIILFDPKLKFTSIGESYTTEKKAHKKQSIAYAKELIGKEFPDLLKDFMSHPKKDDIADSLNQMIVWMISSNIMEMTFSDLRNVYSLD